MNLEKLNRMVAPSLRFAILIRSLCDMGKNNIFFKVCAYCILFLWENEGLRIFHFVSREFLIFQWWWECRDPKAMLLGLPRRITPSRTLNWARSMVLAFILRSHVYTFVVFILWVDVNFFCVCVCEMF